jgi:hypothetical protein
MYIVFDIEGNGLLNTISTIHCLAYSIVDKDLKIVNKGVYTKKAEIINFFNTHRNDTFVGHNIIKFDIPVLKKLFKISTPLNMIDTLGLSWYLFPENQKHGLEYWGNYFKFPKVQIEDWNNLSLQEYISRCEQDVLINHILFKNCYQYLQKIYDSDTSHILSYLNFKLDCLREQEESKIPLDIHLCQSTLESLQTIMKDKILKLSKAMPEDLGKITKKKPAKLYKENKSLTARGIQWFEDLKTLNLPKDTEVIRELPNPSSYQQLKEWLFRLGWKPTTFKDSTTGEKVPQISLPFQGGLCPSIKSLYPVFPILKELDELFVIRHRIGILEGFIDNRSDFYANALGFTNTLRLKHSKPIVNLPKISKPYGKEIRSCLVIPNDKYIMCGADLSSLEDSTKQHFIYFF